VVIVAAGADCRALLNLPFGRAVKGQAMLLDAKLTSPVLFDDGLYILAHDDGTLAIGSTSETKFQNVEPDGRLDDLRTRAEILLPRLKDAPEIRRWAGLRPRGATPDPVIGQVADNLFVATGGFKIGFGLAAKIGEDITRVALGEPADLPPSFWLAHHLSKA
jgi:glycine/D-amino acid oxidase-like deaminating enzyme